MITGRRRLLGGLSASVLLGAGPVGLPRVLGRFVPVALAGPADQARQLAMLVGVPAGSGPDKVSRDFAACLQRHLAATEVEVRNMPGDAGRTMLAALGDAPPDSGTIGWIATPTLPARMIDRNDPGLIRHIRLLAQIEREPIAFVSPATDPVDSVQALIQRAADDADAVPLGTPPPGSPPHLAAIRLQVLAQTRLNIVTFPSAAATVQAVTAGNVSAAALGLSDVIDCLRDGKLAGIGIAARRRFGQLPDTPILNEAGIALSASIRRGVAVPVGIAPEQVETLLTALREVVQDEAFRDSAEAAGYHVAWADETAWMAQMHAEQATLTKLWQTDPWLSSSGG